MATLWIMALAVASAVTLGLLSLDEAETAPAGVVQAEPAYETDISGAKVPIPPRVATAPAAEPAAPTPPVAETSGSTAPVQVAIVPATQSLPATVPAVAATPALSAPPAPSTAADAPSAADPPAPADAPTAGPPDARAAKDTFGSVATPSPLAPRAIGFYSRGCLAGAQMLPVDGPAWQAMRLSRHRNWGHPELVHLVERLALEAKAKDGWPGLLVGDLSQPRGGPMRTGHASHQIGLDADIWLTPMPDRRLTQKEREDIAATDMLGPYKISIDPAVWTPQHVALIKRASGFREVERILVHPAIKMALCEAAGADRDWLRKVRPYWGHNFHFHVRLACPRGSGECRAQAAPPSDDGCGKEIDDWFQLLSVPPKPEKPPDKPAVPRAPMRVDQLPVECRAVLESNEPKSRIARSAAAVKAAAKAAAAAVTGRGGASDGVRK